MSARQKAKYDIYLEIIETGAFRVQYEDGSIYYIPPSVNESKETVLNKLSAGGYTPTGTVTNANGIERRYYTKGK
jgi:hypothetical protein